VEDQDGNVIWEPEPTTVSVMAPEEAWLMVSMMKDVVRRGTAAGTVGSQFHYPAGGKTGTTNDGADVWFIGFTSDIVAGVWMGFDKPQKIKSNAQGGELAAPAWTSFMSDVYRKRPAPRDWDMPHAIVTAEIDGSTNMLATPYCPRDVVTIEFFIHGTDPIGPCDVHVAPMLYPDSSGVTGSYPTTSVIPPIRPIDTSRRPRDSAIFPLPPRDTLPSSLKRPRDSLRVPDSVRVRPRVPPDTGRVP
jgi:penicillin-binding protein 1A